MNYKKILLATVLIMTHSLSHAGKKLIIERIIHLSGLITDSKELTPLSGVYMYDENNILLGTTDNNGYYNIKVHYLKTGPIKFKLTLKKKGFVSFTQNDKWGDLNGLVSMQYYFGLQRLSEKEKGFSIINKNKNNANYTSILESFQDVKQEIAFERQLTVAKFNNEKVFVEINNKAYVLNDTGWIQLQSVNDLVSINGSQAIPANKLNTTIKRSNISKMTPVEKLKGYDLYIELKK